MNLKSIAVLFVLAGATSAHGQESVVLCAPPLTADCVDPKWGQIEPELTAGGGGSAAREAAPQPLADAGARMAVRLQTVATRDGRRADATIKAVVEAGSMFKGQTARLTAAIKRARFDRSGKIVRGEEQIAEAAEAAAKAAPNYALTLYIKVPPTLATSQATLLANKVDAINAILKKVAPTTDAGKPKG